MQKTKLLAIIPFLITLLCQISCTEYDELVPNPEQLALQKALGNLAGLTGGERFDVSSADEVPSAIISIIELNAQEGADIIFLIDNTGSMDDDIAEVKSSLNNILSILPDNAKVGAATYNDNNSTSFWYDWTDLTFNLEIIQTFINGISVFGGGDIPESVYDAVYETVDKMTWRPDAQKLILVVGDAPPHEGSLSTHSLDDVVDKCGSVGIQVNLYPILIGID